MMIKTIYTLISLMGCIVGISSFMIGAPFAGVIGDHYTMHDVPRNTAYKLIRNMEVDSLVSDAPKHVIDEIHEFRNMCLDTEKYDDLCVSIIKENDKKKPEYTLLYRKEVPKGKNITIYTIEAMLLNSQENTNLSILNVFDILDVFCENHRGFLQIYPLKKWAGGRYHNCLTLEKHMKETSEESFEGSISVE